jgi:hypothetical protein
MLALLAVAPVSVCVQLKERLESLGVVVDPRIEVDKLDSHYDIHAHLTEGTEHFEQHLGAGEQRNTNTQVRSESLSPEQAVNGRD